ncbi:hypothetical protein Droror1_Dr00026080 [Drosera rotundifolia]
MANTSIRSSISRCRRWTKSDLAIAALLSTLLIALSLFIISDSKKSSAVGSAAIAPLRSDYVELSLLKNARSKGAYCLDGSVPGYHFQPGFGDGIENWVLHIEGGGWCYNVASCSFRKGTALGSSHHMEPYVVFSGILSQDPMQNPDFFSWNKVKIRYCDGGSFSGHPDKEFNNGTKLFFRGQAIWEALVDEILSLGMKNAKQALLSGCSAGGLATMIHCDDFQRILPRSTVKCLADASFFLDEKDVSGRRTMRAFYQNVVQLQSVAKSLPKDCVAKREPAECFFPEEILKSIRTPIFLVHTAYDFWQIQNVLVPKASDPLDEWRKCKLNIHHCRPSEMEILHGFRDSLLKALDDFKKKKESGMFINSCFIHCQTWMNTWHRPDSPKIDNKTIAEAVGDWYFNRREVNLIDCRYPCNPTCFNVDFIRS